MKRGLITLLVCLAPMIVFAQDVVGFKYGQATYSELDAKTYPADTSANAYVISEYGESSIDSDDPNLINFKYHVKIKILRQEGLNQADIEIVLRKGTDGREEIIRSVYASSFNPEKERITEAKLESKSIFTEKNSQSYNLVKFAIPNAKVGSVIEYQYLLQSPFRLNFKEWEFQSDIPKAVSEYHTIIPGYYVYNTTLRGYLELTSHDSEIMKDCLYVDGAQAECSVNKYVMKNIPAFKDEEYMTARTNFLSAIRYELQQIRYPTGRVEKFTEEWKDVDIKLKNAPDFGGQIKRGKDVTDGYIDGQLAGEKDPLTKAKKIYDFVKFHYLWNGEYGYWTDLGIKKAFDQKKGNVGDINLTLIAALRYAGFNVDPVLIGTRGRGRPVELHPVMTDFNYVIAKLDIDGKTYLLDAVDDFLPFGSISIVCYNGIGRVMNPEGSLWMDINPTEKNRTLTMIALKLEDNGQMTGTISQSHIGYAGLRKRKELAAYQDQKTYLDERKASTHTYSITSYERTGEDDLSKPLIEKFGVEFTAFDPGTQSFLFNPFIEGRSVSNPFKSDQRMFPVDFAVPIEETITIYIDFPESFEITSIPEKVGIALPKVGGGRYTFGSMVIGNKLTVSNTLVFSRSVFDPEEYPYLKEIYSKMIQSQDTDLIFRKKK